MVFYIIEEKSERKKEKGCDRVMDNRDFSNIGEQVSKMVDDAMRSMNFSKLNQDIGRTVNQALEEARRSLGDTEIRISFRM